MISYIIMSKTEFYITIIYWLTIGILIPPVITYTYKKIKEMKQ